MKFAVFARDEKVLLRGVLDGMKRVNVVVHLQYGNKKRTYDVRGPIRLAKAFQLLRSALTEAGIDQAEVSSVGHRVVHGGKFGHAVKITPAVLRELKKYIPLAPLHQGQDIEAIRTAQKVFPEAQHIAVFDTSFFTHLPEKAKYYALPRAIMKKYQLRRAGFHGPSHQHAAQYAAQKLGRPLRKLNLISIHLGSGCSMTAIQHGKPVDTSMGFTPLEGLVMSTRSGDIDPGLMLFLLRQGWNVSMIDRLLHTQSGWYGLSGFVDFRDVLKAAGYPVPNWKLPHKVNTQQKAECRATVDTVLYRLTKYLGAYWAVLGEVDAVICTGAMGAKNVWFRKALKSSSPLFHHAKWLAVESDEELLIARAVHTTVK